ncbi:hypothetical protein MRB53_037892 [Persea americana]|nr:hypothetical protein MRB53_037892 [Persea americana]
MRWSDTARLVVDRAERRAAAIVQPVNARQVGFMQCSDSCAKMVCCEQVHEIFGGNAIAGDDDARRKLGVATGADGVSMDIMLLISIQQQLARGLACTESPASGRASWQRRSPSCRSSGQIQSQIERPFAPPQGIELRPPSSSSSMQSITSTTTFPLSSPPSTPPNKLLPDFLPRFDNGSLTGDVDKPRLISGQYGGAFWSAWLPCQPDIFDFSTEAYEPIVRQTLSQIDLYNRLSLAHPDVFTLASTAKQARKNFAKGKLISPLAIEGLHQIGNSASTLRAYHALGVRYATLTWNCHNIYADAAALTFMANMTTVKAPPLHRGVSPAGRALIHEMNRLGMLVDISHVSAQTMRDVLVGAHEDDNGTLAYPWKGSIAPPIFSHSSAYAVCPHPRNVPDDVLQMVKERGSVVMVNFAPDFISCTAAPEDSTTGMPVFHPDNSTLAQVVRHIRHIGELIGYDHVGIGTDYDGIPEGPKGLEDVSKFPDLVEELLRQGVTEKDVRKVIGENILRVWEEADRVAARLQEEGVLPLEDELHFGFKPPE